MAKFTYTVILRHSSFLFSIWGGPFDPTGSYTPMTQYSDGTAIKSGDFTHVDYPDGYSSLRMTYGDLDAFNMETPSKSCAAILLRDNTDIYKNVHGRVNENEKRAVACQGNN